MDFLNSIILQQIEQDTYKAAYGMAGTIGQILFYLVVLWYVWRMHLHPLKAIPIAFLGLNFALNFNGLILFITSGFTQESTSNLAVAFVYLLPVGWLLAKLFRLRWQAVTEMLTLAMLAFHIPGRSGCIFTGCCHGYPNKWGVYSLWADEYVFPIVLVESLMTLCILVFLFIRMGRKTYVPDGRTMPWMLLLYGIGRFYTEYFHDNEKIWIGCSDIAFHSLFMAAVGLAMLLWLSYRPCKQGTPTPNQP